MIEYLWRVMKNNRFAGYVKALTIVEAERRAVEFYGKEVWVEKVIQKKVS